MLETIREYGRELLHSTEPAGGEELYRRHARYYMTLAEEGRKGVLGPRQEMWLDRFEAEYDNMQAALKWAIERGEAETALYLGGALWISRGFRPYYHEGYQWLREALGLPGAQARNRARAVALMGASLMNQHRLDWASSRAYIEESISILRELGPEERGELGIALLLYGNYLSYLGEHEAARAAMEEGISLLRQAGNKWDLAYGLYMQGFAANVQGDPAAARDAFEESIALSREVGNTWFLSHALNSLGDASRMLGDYPRAWEVYEESLSLFRRLNARVDIPALLHNLGHVALGQGRAGDAEKLFVEALRLQISYNNRAGIVECLAGLAGVAGAQQHPERAARLFGAAETLQEGPGEQVWLVERADNERNRQSAQAQLDEGAWEKAWQEGRAMALREGGMEQAIAYALEDVGETASPTVSPPTAQLP
jgi:tetratricopeptide (TPR) repeat protein